jgi:predicted permease
MDAVWRDLKHSARAFVHTPAFTIAAIAALALGMGVNTAIFSVVNTVLLKPFGFSDPERVVMFQNTFRSGLRTGSAAPTEFNWWRQHADAFQDISAYEFNVANLTGEFFPEQIPTMRVSAGFFSLCGAKAILGRTFTAADDVPGAPRTVVLAHSLWQRRFGGDPKAVGRRITLNGERYEIIGIAGPQKDQIAERSLLSGDIEIDGPPDVYFPFQIDPNSADRGHGFNVAGRLRPGVTLAAANTQVQAGYREYARRWTGLTPNAGFGIQPLQEAVVGGVRHSLLILLGAVSLVLLIACANVANLLLVRATGRKREIAIRAAVGAGRGRIARQLLTESVVLSLVGGILGLAAGYAGIHAILSLSPGIPRIGAGGANVHFDGRVFGFALALSILTGILFGLIPALQSSRADLSSALKAGGHRSGAGLRTDKTRALLVTGEVALAVILLIGAALLIRSFIALRQVNPGFDAHRVLTMRVSLTGPQFANPVSVARVIHESVRRIRALPGVEAAATTCCVPLDSRLQVGFQIAGCPQGPSSGGVTGWTEVSAGYFEVFKIPILHGRTFSERDEIGPPVVIVNETLAKQFWLDSDPLNGQIILGSEAPMQIVGVAGDVRDRGLNREPGPTLYVPSVTPGGLLKLLPWAWVIRTKVAPASLSLVIRKQLREASGGLPVGQVRTMEEVLARSTAAADFNALVMTIFGCSALLLASIGIYGLMAYTVFQRVHEIGIRLALGAESTNIRNMIVLHGLRPGLAGIGCGLAAALWLTGWIASFLFGVKAWDPLVFLAAPLILAGVALLAVWLPAMRASRVDPIRALRYE